MKILKIIVIGFAFFQIGCKHNTLNKLDSNTEKPQQKTIEIDSIKKVFQSDIKTDKDGLDSISQVIRDSMLMNNPVDFVIGSVDKMYYFFDSSRIVLQTHDENGYNVLRFGVWGINEDSINISYFKEVVWTELLTTNYETPESDGIVEYVGWEKTINNIREREGYNWITIYNKVKSNKYREWSDWTELRDNATYESFYDKDSAGYYKYEE